jgi:glutathione S-transferase
MLELYHFWFSPFSRFARLILEEKKQDYTLKPIKFWQPPEEFTRMNPTAELPVLRHEHHIIVDSMPIVEYLQQIIPEPYLLGRDAAETAEIRRLVGWCHRRFYQDAVSWLIHERIYSQMIYKTGPNSDHIRKAKKSLEEHLRYFEWILSSRHCLASKDISIADFALVAHLSCLDYMGDIEWQKFEELKTWYMRLKSRQSVRTILKDQMPGMPPPTYYQQLDF